MMRIWLALTVITFLARPCSAATRENSCHTMAAGTFGVAMIGSTGEILVSDGRSVPQVLLAGRKAARIVAADLTGDGTDELAFLGAERHSLFYYDFAAQKVTGGYGHNVRGMSSGTFLADDKFASVVASTFTAVPYRWTIEIGDKHWHELPGDFVEVVRADTDTRNKVDEFAVISRGDVYVYHPIWQTYKQVLLGRDAKAIIAGDITASEGDEILVTCGETGQLMLCQKRQHESLNHSARCLAVGRIDDGPNQAFVIGAQGVIERYNRQQNIFDTAFADNNSEWHCLILADTDADGYDEIYAARSDELGTLYRFDKSKTAFEALVDR